MNNWEEPKLGFAVKPSENGTCLVTKGGSIGVVVRANDEAVRRSCRTGSYRFNRTLHDAPRP